MSTVTQNASSTSQVTQQPQCHCDLAHSVNHYKSQARDLQERLAIARRRNFDLQKRLEDLEGAMFQPVQTPCGDEAGGKGEEGDGLGDWGEEGGREIALQEILAQEEAQVISDPNWPAIASPMRVSMRAKHKLIVRVLGEVWKEEHTLLSESSKLKQKLEREREETILQEREGDEWRSAQRDLHKENQELNSQISRLEEQLSRIAQLTRGD